MEVADAVSGGQVLRFTRGTRQGRAEEDVDVFRQGTDKPGEWSVVEEFEHPALALGGRFSVTRRCDGRVLRTANRSRSPAFTRARREPKVIGRRNGNVSTAPSVTILPFSDTAARRPGTGSAATPSAVNTRPDADSGEPKTWAPKLSQ